MSESLAEIRSRIEALGMNFKFTGTIKTNMNGIERETWLLEYEGAQFVFVAGQKNVTLGWDIDQCPLGEGLLKGLREEFDLIYSYYYQVERMELQEDYQGQIKEANAKGDTTAAKKLESELEEELKNFDEDMNENGYTSWENFIGKWNEYLSKCLSPLRTVDISDMIVEVDSRYLNKDAQSLSQVVSLLKEGLRDMANGFEGDGYKSQPFAQEALNGLAQAKSEIDSMHDSKGYHLTVKTQVSELPDCVKYSVLFGIWRYRVRERDSQRSFKDFVKIFNDGMY